MQHTTLRKTHTHNDCSTIDRSEPGPQTHSTISCPAGFHPASFKHRHPSRNHTSAKTPNAWGRHSTSCGKFDGCGLASSANLALLSVDHSCSFWRYMGNSSMLFTRRGQCTRTQAFRRKVMKGMEAEWPVSCNTRQFLKKGKTPRNAACLAICFAILQSFEASQVKLGIVSPCSR